MDFNTVKPYFEKVGEFISNITSSIVKKLGELGLNVSPIASKIISLILISLITFIFIKFSQSFKPMIKWIIIILMVLLVMSIFLSF